MHDIQMKRVFMLFIVMLFGIVLVGCNSEREEKVNVDFKMDSTSSIVTVNKGTIITKDIPFFKENVGKMDLYYDESKNEKYKDEPINEDTTIYVIIKDEVNKVPDEELINEARQAYLDTYLKNNREDAVIDDVCLFNYLGIYNDSLVGVFLDRKNCIFCEVEHAIKIEGLDFVYSEGYEITVYKDGSFFTLYESYFTNNIITFNDLNEVYKVYYKLGEQ